MKKEGRKEGVGGWELARPAQDVCVGGVPGDTPEPQPRGGFLWETPLPFRRGRRGPREGQAGGGHPGCRVTQPPVTTAQAGGPAFLVLPGLSQGGPTLSEGTGPALQILFLFFIFSSQRFLLFFPFFSPRLHLSIRLFYPPLRGSG